MPGLSTQQNGWELAILACYGGDSSQCVTATAGLPELRPGSLVELNVPNTGTRYVMATAAGFLLTASPQIEIVRGWNMVSLPFVPTSPYRASDLVNSLRRDGIAAVHVAQWQNGAWRSYIPGFGLDDFPLQFGRGYFVKAESAGTWLGQAGP